jgi:hypothetical protein
MQPILLSFSVASSQYSWRWHTPLSHGQKTHNQTLEVVEQQGERKLVLLQQENKGKEEEEEDERKNKRQTNASCVSYAMN